MSIRRYIGRIKSTLRSGSDHGSTSTEVEPISESNDFADPSRWKRLVDDNRHVHQYITEQPAGGFCTFRGNWSGPIKAYKRCSLIPAVKQIIDQTGWQRLLTINTEKSSMKLVEAFVERWWDTTHTFHLPCCELGFTPLDWTMLTGISIGSGEVPPCSDDIYPFEVVQDRFFPEITAADWKGQGIRSSFLKKYFHKSIIEAGQEDNLLALKIARAFIMFFLCEFLFSNASCVIRSGWLAAIEDLEKVGTYDWGGQAMALLYMSLDSCSRLKVKSFNGPWQVLEYWAYEYTNICAPITVQTEHIVDKWPRITRWNKDELDTNITDQVRYNISIARHQLEMRSSASIIWQPYSKSSHEYMGINGFAHLLSRNRVIFQYASQGVWYLGDRCYRQFTGIICIPVDPPPSMPRVSANDFCPPIDASVLVRDVPQSVYDKYWATVSIGAIMPTLSHATNVDFIGPASITDPNIQLPFPPPCNWAPTEYIAHAPRRDLPECLECVVEVPLYSGGTVTRNVEEGSVSFLPRDALSYEDLYQRYLELTYNDTILRRFILNHTVLRESIPAPRRSVSTRRSVSMERPESSRQNSTPDFVPNTQFDSME